MSLGACPRCAPGSCLGAQALRDIVYVVLRELEDEDLATSALEAKRAGRGTQRRYYGLTPAGQELVERHRRGSTAR